MFFDELRLKVARAVARRIQLKLAVLGPQRLAGVTVAAVAWTLVFLALGFQMVRQFGIQRVQIFDVSFEFGLRIVPLDRSPVPVYCLSINI